MQEEKMKYREGANSYVHHEGRDFLVDDLLDATENKPMREMKIAQLDWIIGDMSELDAGRIGRAKTVYPLIVTEQTIPRRWVVLDGFHRLCSAILQERTLVKVRVITSEELELLHQQRLKPIFN